MSARAIHTPPESKGEATAGSRLKGRRILVLGGGQMDIGEADTPIGNGRAMSVLFAPACRRRARGKRSFWRRRVRASR